MILFALAGLIAGCDSNQSGQQTGAPHSPNERIVIAQKSLMRVRVTLEKFPWLQVVTATTRDYLILREVELSDEPMDRKTREDLAEAKLRAEDARYIISKFSPMLERLERELLDLRGALYWVIQSDDLSPEISADLVKCRSRIYELLEDLRLAQKVISNPDSVEPRNSKYYAPDFHVTLDALDAALWDAEYYQAQQISR